MFKTSTILLGTGVLVAGLAAPMAANAGSQDEALAFVAGAVVGHVLSDQTHHVHYVHRRHPVFVPPGHRYRHHGWHKRHEVHRRWDSKHRRFDGHYWRDHDRRHHRYERRDDRRERRDHRRG